MQADIRQIRAFNRTVTRRFGVLSGRYLGRDRPLVQSRLLFEIGAAGAPVRELRGRLGLDSGFLSRLLRALERQDLVITCRAGDDGRVRIARLTRAGRAELRRLDALSDELAQSMLAPLSVSQGRRLVSAMAEVDRLLRGSSVEISLTDAASAQVRGCLGRYFEELDARFPGGFDVGIDEAADARQFEPPQGGMVVARLFGEAVGCGALRTLERRVGEIKRMWVRPDVRGLGVGRRLLAHLERLARERALSVVRLDTHESLAEALQLYRSAGYREIPPYNDNPYAQRWFEKRLGRTHRDAAGAGRRASLRA